MSYIIANHTTIHITYNSMSHFSNNMLDTKNSCLHKTLIMAGFTIILSSLNTHGLNSYN